MKRFAWLMLFLSLGLFAYVGCGGPGSTPADVEEEANIADMDLQGMGGEPEEVGGEGGEPGGEAGGEEPAGDDAGGEEPAGDEPG